MITTEEIKAKYWALEVLASNNQADMGNISGSLETSKIDMNPHQIEAALLFPNIFRAGELPFWLLRRQVFASNGRLKCRRNLICRPGLLRPGFMARL